MSPFSWRPRIVPLATLCIFLFTVALLVGCRSQVALSPASISRDPYASGDEQCGLQGELLPSPLRVIVEAPRRRGLLGGKGSARPVVGARVTFAIAEPAAGAAFAANGLARLEVPTDVAGSASATVRLGSRPGNVCITASVDTPSGAKSVRFRVLCGVELIGHDLEEPTGGTIDSFGVRLQDGPGTPAAGIEACFRVADASSDSSVGDELVWTDERGLATTSWTLGKSVRPYFASVTLRDTRPAVPQERRFTAGPITFHAMAMSKTKMLVKLFGGLAIFLVGMKGMSAGLRRMADRRLKAILQAMTRNRFLATGVGAGLTAMVQSSSAVTVMTVGFVNAGLMTLTQAIGVVYGASIGTTITAQIVAFQLDWVAYPAVAVGLAMTALGRRPWLKALGEAIMGFGLLFLGMTIMSDTLKPLRHSPEFQALFQLFDCSPVDGRIPAMSTLMCIVIGTVATCIVQSSSATVGLVIALSGQGLVSFYTAVPLVVGDNIGTTITAILASLGANRNAKRAALAHALYKIFGAAWMYLLLFVPLWHGQPVFLGFVDHITPGEVFAAAPENLTRHVANAHTAFNVLNCMLFLPFVDFMARLCRKVIPVTDADRETVLEYLEPHLLDSPSLALQQAVREVGYMLRRAQKSINEGCEFFYGGPSDLAQKIKAREDLIDRLQAEITSYLVELSRKELAPMEATLIPALIHAVNDAERIGDHSENLVELTHLKHDNQHTITDTAEEDIRRLQDLLNQQFDVILRTLGHAESNEVDHVLVKEEEITELVKAATEAHVRRLEAQTCEVQAGVVFLDFIAHLERVGDHLVNIAERAGRIMQVTGS